MIRAKQIVHVVVLVLCVSEGFATTSYVREKDPVLRRSVVEFVDASFPRLDADRRRAFLRNMLESPVDTAVLLRAEAALWWWMDEYYEPCSVRNKDIIESLLAVWKRLGEATLHGKNGRGGTVTYFLERFTFNYNMDASEIEEWWKDMSTKKKVLKDGTIEPVTRDDWARLAVQRYIDDDRPLTEGVIPLRIARITGNVGMMYDGDESDELEFLGWWARISSRSRVEWAIDLVDSSLVTIESSDDVIFLKARRQLDCLLPDEVLVTAGLFPDPHATVEKSEEHDPRKRLNAEQLRHLRDWWDDNREEYRIPYTSMSY